MWEHETESFRLKALVEVSGRTGVGLLQSHSWGAWGFCTLWSQQELCRDEIILLTLELEGSLPSAQSSERALPLNVTGAHGSVAAALPRWAQHAMAGGFHVVSVFCCVGGSVARAQVPLQAITHLLHAESHTWPVSDRLHLNRNFYF